MKEQEPIVICRLTRKQASFSAGDIVIRRNETNYQHNGRVTQVKSYITVYWRHTDSVVQMPREQLMHYDEWLALQEKQKQAKNFWSMAPAEQDKIRGNS